VKDENGKVLYTIALIEDISDRKLAEQIIQETNKKINLLTSITRHDVANQVSVLRGYTRIALMKKIDPVVVDLFEKIDLAASTIARQIEFTREYQELSMHSPGWQKIGDIVGQQKTDGISLSCTCDAEIFADPMLERVFFNLIDNALRHGEKVTAITVSCRPGPDDSLVIAAGDNGCGVPPDLKDMASTRVSGSSLPGRSSQSPASPSAKRGLTVRGHDLRLLCRKACTVLNRNNPDGIFSGRNLRLPVPALPRNKTGESTAVFYGFFRRGRDPTQVAFPDYLIQPSSTHRSYSSVLRSLFSITMSLKKSRLPVISASCPGSANPFVIASASFLPSICASASRASTASASPPVAILRPPTETTAR
jgi:hypothetical protein